VRAARTAGSLPGEPPLQTADWVVLTLYFVWMVLIGAWSYRRVRDAHDFFAAGGRMPWWMAGMSHHVSGSSAVVFTGYAAVAYTAGFTLYVWWALPIGTAVLLGAFLVAPRWARLRARYRVGSPTEYLKTRYNLATQQLLAWSGSLLKVFDVGAKYAAIAVILHVITGAPPVTGVLIAGAVSLVYVTIGGLWADALTDLAQLAVQAAAAVVMCAVVLAHLGGVGAAFTMWDDLPAGHAAPFAGEFTPAFTLAFFAVAFLSYSGGTWNLAQRFIASPSGSDARKAALLSSALFFTFPLVLFLPMWASPLIFPALDEPQQVYALMAREFLPPGLLGLVVAAMFAATMSMTASDSNAVAAVITRDILPGTSRRFAHLSPARSLRVARVTTFVFTAATLLVAVYADTFGGILGLIVVWFTGLLGPTAVPMILGLIPAFRHSGPAAAIGSWALGVATFALAHLLFAAPFAASVGLPVLVSATVFATVGWLGRGAPLRADVAEIFAAIERD
jgi:solute:Na+ symporter, SSS family